MIEAVRYGNDPQVLRRLDSVVDKTFGADNLQRLFTARALSADKLKHNEIIDINQSLIRGRSRKFFIEDFFLAAFRKLGGQIYNRGGGHYENFHVPKDLRNDNVQASVAFDGQCLDYQALWRSFAARFNLYRRHRRRLPRDFFVTAEIFDGQSQILARKIFFVTVAADGKNFSVHNELCLDYRSPSTSTRQKILSAAKNLPLPELERLAAKCTAQKIFKCRDKFAERQNFNSRRRQHYRA